MREDTGQNRVLTETFTHRMSLPNDYERTVNLLREDRSRTDRGPFRGSLDLSSYTTNFNCLGFEVSNPRKEEFQNDVLV